MLKPVVVIATLACVIAFGVVELAPAAEQGEPSATREIVIRDHDGDELASVPLAGNRFAVSYRNSIYATLAEERYVALPHGRFRLRQVAADQLAVLEEYYALGSSTRTGDADRRTWVAPPDPARTPVFEELSIAATDLGERTLHVPGERPLALWRLVDDNPFVVLDIKESPA